MLHKHKKQSAALIIGAGYLGRTLIACLAARGETVYASTRREENLHGLKQSGIQAGLLDVNESQTWGLLEQVARQHLHLYLLIPPSQILPPAFKTLVARLQALPLDKAVLVSSTVVYGRREREVDADSEVEIDCARAQRQHEIEAIWRGLGSTARIVRLAGLYGPGRIIGSKTLRKGTELPGRADAWLNLIHVQDAARLLIKIGHGEHEALVELGCDGRPLKRRDYYAALAAHLHLPPPVFVDAGQAALKGRRCNNQITMQRTGWQPECLDYKASF